MDSGLLASTSLSALRGWCAPSRDPFREVRSATGLRTDICGFGGSGGATSANVSLSVREDMDRGGSADENGEVLARPGKKSGPE